MSEKNTKKLFSFVWHFKNVAFETECNSSKFGKGFIGCKTRILKEQCDCECEYKT